MLQALRLQPPPLQRSRTLPGLLDSQDEVSPAATFSSFSRGFGGDGSLAVGRRAAAPAEREVVLPDLGRSLRPPSNLARTPQAQLVASRLPMSRSDMLQLAMDSPPEEETWIHVPGVGRMLRRQLRNLQGVLDTRPNRRRSAAGVPVSRAPPDAEDIPDLRNFSSEQLGRLEEALSSGLLEAPEAERVVPAIVPPQVILPPVSPEAAVEEADLVIPAQETESDQEMALEDSPTPLETEPEEPAERAPPAGDRPSSAKHWRIEEESFANLFQDNEWVQALLPPEGLECSICCEEVDLSNPSTGCLALPCAKRGCCSAFHEVCIRPWLERNPSCPLCRCDMHELVRPVTPSPFMDGTGCPLFDFWLMALAQEYGPQAGFQARNRSDEAEDLPRWTTVAELRGAQPRRRGSLLQRLQGVVLTASALVQIIEQELHHDELPPARVLADIGPERRPAAGRRLGEALALSRAASATQLL